MYKTNRSIGAPYASIVFKKRRNVHPALLHLFINITDDIQCLVDRFYRYIRFIG